MSNKVVLVTGGSRGIGEGIARGFGAAGYHVVVNYLSEEAKAAAVVRDIVAAGGGAEAVRCDVSDGAAIGAMVADIVERHGRLDAVVNNAGMCRNHRITNIADAEWDDVVNVGLRGVFLVIKAAAKPLMRRKEGAIINISSVTGLRGGFGNANYAAAKGGLIALTKTAARELGRFNVTVNAVLPGFHLTDMGRTATADYLEQVRRECVLPQTTDLRELARFIVLLAETKTVSGQVFNWDSRIL